MEKKRIIIIVAVLLTVLVLAAAITVTLVLVLKKKPSPTPSSPSPTPDDIISNTSTFPNGSSTISEPSPTPSSPGPTLDDIISNNSTFPNGSYPISAQSLQSGLADLAPLVVNISMLNSLGLRIDNSSMVAETNRLSYFFIRLPAYVGTNNSTITNRVQLQTKADVNNIGVRFGDSDTINVVPLNLSLVSNSGLSFLGYLQDDSQVYQLEVRMSDIMCVNAAAGSCSIVNWTPYSISSASSGSKADFDNQLPVACGSQCNAAADSPCATSCSTCDGQQVAGADTPVTRRYNMGTKSAQRLKFLYETYSVPDRVTVTYEGDNIFDSTCIGTNGEQTAFLNYSGSSMELRVDVEPNCMGTTGTAWYFQLGCANNNCTDCQEYQCMDDQQAHCGPDGYLLGYGLYFCNRYMEYYSSFTSDGQEFINCVKPRLLSFLENYLANVRGAVSCSDLYDQAFKSHEAAYWDCGFCDVFCSNKIAFLEVLSPALDPTGPKFSSDAVWQAENMAKRCGYLSCL